MKGGRHAEEKGALSGSYGQYESEQTAQTRQRRCFQKSRDQSRRISG